ncbi:MAG TPA: hypothetical protein VE178_10765 [Silvibacterium sp.]|jgi:hypothetical protein|nr:hypothetical protein [Silvibacterium sp.]
MKRHAAIWIMFLAWPVLVTTAGAQANHQPQTSATASDGTQSKNMQEYFELLRSDIRQRKAEVTAEMMQLSAADAAKFWPIYNDYDAELNKLSDLRVATIEEYARTYNQMTNEKADELIRKALGYRKQRAELLSKYYDRIKQQLGAITAARFVQIEDQLLALIDLQIDSALPIVGQSS